MFSNGNEADHWRSNNCDICIKYENESVNRKDARCKIAYDIDLGYVAGELSKRVQKIVLNIKCPFLKTERLKRQKRIKKDVNQVELL